MPDVEPPTHGRGPFSLKPYQWILGVAESVRYWDCIVIVSPLSPLSPPLERQSCISQMLGWEEDRVETPYIVVGSETACAA